MVRARPPVAELEQRIGHAFADPDLLTRALTHVSATKVAKHRRDTYQRLEFLGDRVLGLAVADMLCASYPDASEGDLSKRLSELVRKETCAEIAVEWGAAEHIKLGASEAQSGGRKKTAILGDVCEAIIGAVYLDAGWDKARTLVTRSWEAKMRASKRPPRDAKTWLQEWAQGRGLAAPVYRVTGRSGPEHLPLFTLQVEITGFEPCAAEGTSKRIAEQAAARAFLEREGVTPPELATPEMVT